MDYVFFVLVTSNVYKGRFKGMMELFVLQTMTENT